LLIENGVFTKFLSRLALNCDLPHLLLLWSSWDYRCVTPCLAHMLVVFYQQNKWLKKPFLGQFTYQYKIWRGLPMTNTDTASLPFTSRSKQTLLKGFVLEKKIFN
jgi:hypothetical protein